MEYFCCYEKCSARAEFFCSCDETFHCATHVSSYISGTCLTSHFFTPLFKTFKPAWKKIVLSNLESLLNLVTGYKKQLLSLTQEILGFLNSLQTTVTLAEKYLKINFLEVEKNNRFYWNIKSTSSSITQKTLDLTSFESISKYLKKKLNCSKLLKISESFQNLSKKRLEFDLISLNEHENQLYFCSDETTSLFSFDTTNNKISFLPFQENFLKRRSSAVCPLEDNQVFIYGGWNGKALKSTLIVDVSTKTVKMLDDGIRRSQASPQLLNNKVYIFAGCTSGEVFTKDCHYFDLKTETWRQITSFPIPSRNTSTLLHGKDILITTSETLLVTYNVKRDIFKTFNLSFSINTINLLLSHSDSIVLISNPYVFKSSKADLKSWTQVQSCSIKNTTTSKPVRPSDSSSLYFVDSKRKFYKLDLESFSVERLKPN